MSKIFVLIICLWFVENISPAFTQAQALAHFHFVVNGPDAGKCLDEIGKPGLNQNYFGDCGDLRGNDFSGKTFNQVSLRGANLTGANLNNTKFYRTRFDFSKLESAFARNAKFTDCSFLNAQMIGIDARYSWFTRSSLDGASLISAVLQNSDFQETSFKNTRLADANANHANFSGCNLDKIVAVFTNFTAARLIGSSIGGAYFFNSNFTDADLREVKGERANFDSAVFLRTRLNNSELTYFSMQNASFTGASLQSTHWTFGNLTKTHFYRTDFMNGFFARNSFLNVSIEDSKLNHAFFAFSDFRNANLKKANLSGVELQNAVFGPGTQSQLSLSELQARKVIESNSSARVKVLVREVDEDESWVQHPKELLLGTITQVKTLNDPSEISAETSDADTYAVPLMLDEVWNTTVMVDALKGFLSTGFKRLILLDGNPFLIKGLTAHVIPRESCGGELETFNVQREIEMKYHIYGIPAGIINFDSSFGCLFDPVRWSTLPKDAEVLYGNRESDLALVFRLPSGTGEIWSIGYNFGGRSYTGDRQKEEIDQVLKAIVLSQQ